VRLLHCALDIPSCDCPRENAKNRKPCGKKKTEYIYTQTRVNRKGGGLLRRKGVCVCNYLHSLCEEWRGRIKRQCRERRRNTQGRKGER
jgi:hypothetical protein